ncbi:hypothetical protein JOQ06_027021, partial [Pogonophryne albipinna]
MNKSQWVYDVGGGGDYIDAAISSLAISDEQLLQNLAQRLSKEIKDTTTVPWPPRKDHLESGVSISYADTLLLYDHWALMDLEASATCPQEIADSKPAIVIVDNDDFKIDTMTGNSTGAHRTNQISYIYAIYKRFKGSGMADTLVTAGVIMEGEVLIQQRLKNILEHEELSENIKENLNTLRNALTDTWEALRAAHSHLEDDDGMKELITRVYEKPGTDMGDFWISFMEMSDPLCQRRHRKHVECQPARMRKDEQEVQDLQACMKDFDAEHFDISSPKLRSLQSGLVASPELVHDLETALPHGQAQAGTLMQERVFTKIKPLTAIIHRNKKLNFA